MQGWMWKLGAVRKAWKRRWFVLSYGCLSYWEKQPSPGHSPLGWIPLEHAELEEEADRTTGYRFSFIIFTTLDRDYSLRAGSESEALEWIVTIKKAILQANLKTKKLRNKKKKGPWLANLLQRKKKPAVEEEDKPAAQLEEKAKAAESDETHHPTFGVPLQEVLERDGVEYQVPFVVRQAVDYIETTALEIQGIFRLSGDNEMIQLLRQRFERGENVDLFQVKDAHTVAGLLKLFVRELPEPLGMFDLYSDWLAASQLPKEDMIAEIRRLVQLLPDAHMLLLRALADMLRKVSEFSAINSMSAKNLAIVFAPNLFRARNENCLQSLKDTPFTLSVTLTIIEEQDRIFSKPMAPISSSLSLRASSAVRMSMVPDEAELDTAVAAAADDSDEAYAAFLAQFPMLRPYDEDDGPVPAAALAAEPEADAGVGGEDASKHRLPQFAACTSVAEMEARMEGFLRALEQEQVEWPSGTPMMAAAQVDREHEALLLDIAAMRSHLLSAVADGGE